MHILVKKQHLSKIGYLQECSEIKYGIETEHERLFWVQLTAQFWRRSDIMPSSERTLQEAWYIGQHMRTKIYMSVEMPEWIKDKL